MKAEITLSYRVSQELYSSAVGQRAAYFTKSNRSLKYLRTIGNIAYWIVVFVLLVVFVQAVQAETKAHFAALGFFAGMFFVGVALWALIFWTERQISKRAAEIEVKRGTTHTTFSSEGISYCNDIEQYRLSWLGVDGAIELDGGTGVIYGPGFLPIPDDALPEGMSSDDFRKRIEEWVAAK
ncbi:hypothetical protein [Leisingera aquimarina]|uniref:hypothetical protein n=1 Tax=Leisingera aquimarina TaxID=476529 RepID=UPI00047FBE2A|nr:hypothetical protein [Leisingera aquimarina]